MQKPFLYRVTTSKTKINLFFQFFCNFPLKKNFDTFLTSNLTFSRQQNTFSAQDALDFNFSFLSFNLKQFKRFTSLYNAKCTIQIF